MIRFLWGAVDVYRFGPYLDHWLLFIKERRVAHKTWKLYNKFVYCYVLLAAVVFVLPDVFHNLHWTYNTPKLNAVKFISLYK